MVVLFRRTAAMGAMMLVLLLGSAGGAIRAEAASSVLLHSSKMHPSHYTVNFPCPPPPRICVPGHH